MASDLFRNIFDILDVANLHNPQRNGLSAKMICGKRRNDLLEKSELLIFEFNPRSMFQPHDIPDLVQQTLVF